MINLNDSTKWALTIEHKITAKFINAYQYYQILETPINILFNKPLIGVLIKCQNDVPNTWVYGGKINQYIPANITSASVITTASIDSYRLKLNQINLLEINMNLSNNYSLTYIPPKWFYEITITIWEYTDTNINSTSQKLTLLQSLLSDVDNRVKAIEANIKAKNKQII
jgi:hypothetical protein